MAGEVVAEHVGAITIVAGADRASGETHWTVMMKPVDYDVVAPAYDTRYERNRYDGVRDVLQRFIGEPGSVDAAEVGCGTGHWLAEIRGRIRTAAGLDLSAEMLQRARAAAPFALVVRGRAEKLPWAAGSFDRIFCINALHHFGDADAFIIEARRVLRPSGALMIIGLVLIRSWIRGGYTTTFPRR